MDRPASQIKVDINIKSAYDEQYTDATTYWRELGGKYKAQHIVELCSDLHVQNALEVGAGEGSILMFLDQWKFCKELHALEISRSGLDFIRRRNLSSLKTAESFDGYQIPFEDNAFDLVILSHVLEHVEFPRLLLREIKRVSKYQVIEVPIDYSPKVDELVDHFLSYGHINVYTPPLLRFLLKAEGFVILRDKLSLMTKDVLEYVRKPRTFSARLKLNLLLLRRNIFWSLGNQQSRERRASAYTVLCKGGTSRRILS